MTGDSKMGWSTPRDEDGRLGGIEVNYTEAVWFFYAEEVIEVRLLKGSP